MKKQSKVRPWEKKVSDHSCASTAAASVYPSSETETVRINNNSDSDEISFLSFDNEKMSSNICTSGVVVETLFALADDVFDCIFNFDDIDHAQGRGVGIMNAPK